MVPSDMCAKFGADRPRNEKLSGTQYFSPGPVRQRLSRRPARSFPHRPLVPRPASEKFKVVGFVSKSVGHRPGSQVTCLPNLVQIGREMKNFLGLRFFPRAG